MPRNEGERLFSFVQCIITRHIQTFSNIYHTHFPFISFKVTVVVSKEGEMAPGEVLMEVLLYLCPTVGT